MKKFHRVKKLIAVSCASLLIIAICTPTIAVPAWRNFWLDYGYNQGTSRSEYSGGELCVVVAQVRQRSTNQVVNQNQSTSYNATTVTVPYTWNYSKYTNNGLCYPA